MRYLLDTNICIDLIKKHPPEILERFRKHSPQDVAISTITLFELQYGVEKSQYRQRSEDALDKFILPLNIIELDRSDMWCTTFLILLSTTARAQCVYLHFIFRQG